MSEDLKDGGEIIVDYDEYRQQGLELARLRAEREMVVDDSCFWYEEGGSPFVTSREEGAPPPPNPRIRICVNTSDAFAWGTADAEDIPDDQFWRVYDIWKKFGLAGAVAWAMEHRGVDKLFMAYEESFESRLQAARAELKVTNARA